MLIGIIAAIVGLLLGGAGAWMVIQRPMQVRHSASYPMPRRMQSAR
jgi:hypothetical protein